MRGLSRTSELSVVRPPITCQVTVRTLQRRKCPQGRGHDSARHLFAPTGSLLASYKDARARNQELLAHALRRIAQCRLPTVVAGDFNCKVQALPAWDHFRFLGYQEVFELAETRYGKQLPPTCKRSSRHDTLLLPPCLQQRLCRATVLTHDKLFDSHDPLVVTLRATEVEHPLTWRNRNPGPPCART